MKTSDLYEPTLSFGLLLIGPPKTGKTQLALAFPNVYVADCDNNLGGAVRFLRRTNPSFRFYYDTINIADDSDFCKSNNLTPGEAVPAHLRWDRLVLCCKEAAKNPEIQTIVVDSLSFVNDYLCDHIVARKSPNEEKQMTIKDWVPFKNLLTKFITTFRSVNKLFVMTAHEMIEKDEGTGILVYKPYVQSRLQDNIGGYFSDVWLCQCEKVGETFKWYVKTMPQTRRALGNSLGLPENFVFSWPELEKYLAKHNKQSLGS